VGAALVSPEGRAFEYNLEITDDTYISGLKDLVKTMHMYGAKAAVQLFHGGRLAEPDLIGCVPVAPSPVVMPSGYTTRELTIDEIVKLVASFTAAALRAKKAGFDGIEIHGAHGYLVDQFLSPSSNKRRDIYGGNVENRARFLIDSGEK